MDAHMSLALPTNCGRATDRLATGPEDARERRQARVREARLLQHRLSDRQQLAAETPKEREACLFQLRVNQQQQLAAETPQETGARRQCDRDNHMEQPSSHSHQQPLFNQPAVRSKMTTFHSRMRAALQVPTCYLHGEVPWHDSQSDSCWHRVCTV